MAARFRFALPVKHVPERFDGRKCQCSQIVVEGDLSPPLRLGIEERARGHGLSGHVFKTKRLRAKLHFVGAMEFRLAALVFHRKGNLAAAILVEFDEIGDARDPRRGEPMASAVTRRTPRTRLPPGLSAATCSTWPSAVNLFSSQRRSRWIRAAWRRQ